MTTPFQETVQTRDTSFSQDIYQDIPMGFKDLSEYHIWVYITM